MQNFFRLFSFLFLLPLMASAYQPKTGNITATLGPYIFETNYHGHTPSVNSPPLTGFGLIANGDANDHGALEIGLFYMNKLFFREQYGYSLAEKTPLLKVNIGYRYWFLSWLSGSLTFDSMYTSGTPSVIYNNFPASQGEETSAHAVATYGFDFALQQELLSRERFSLMIDERYSKSITARSGEKADDYGIMVGLRYFIQKKQIINGPPPVRK